MNFLKILLLVVMALPLTLTASSGVSLAQNIKEEISDIIDFEEIVYTQVGLWTEKNHILATNYSKGEFIPVNSPVRIKKLKASYIALSYNNSIIYLKNTKYTNIDISQLFSRTFSINKVDLSTFDQDEQGAILFGDVIVGMSKDAVIVSRGYPPAHQTRSLESNNWKYWNSRFDTINYRFKDNRVFQIKE